jgi:type II secretion system protein G
VRPKEYILLAACIAMIGMLIIPKIISYENAHKFRGHSRPFVDLNGGLKSALGAYQVDNGSYPKGSNGLDELLQQPTGATNWRGPYLEKYPVDPWGHKYIYEYPGKHNPSSYDLSSAGPDGTAGTDDDIGNWMN